MNTSLNYNPMSTKICIEFPQTLLLGLATTSLRSPDAYAASDNELC